jgi:hypothetical protein
MGEMGDCKAMCDGGRTEDPEKEKKKRCEVF